MEEAKTQPHPYHVFIYAPYVKVMNWNQFSDTDRHWVLPNDTQYIIQHMHCVMHHLWHSNCYMFRHRDANLRESL